MTSKDDFKPGKLYYMCTFSSNEPPIPEIESYILEKADEGGLHFIKPSVLIAHKLLEKLTPDERRSVENILTENRTLYVPFTELEALFETPSGAIEFLENSLSNKAFREFL